jgi:ABC-type branched-subunit amino acid transport system ATPase component
MGTGVGGGDIVTTLTEPIPATRRHGSGEGLEARGLSVAYGGNLAVSGVSLSAPLGQITGLIGPNGAGKTTTFNACNGLLKPTRGTVHLFGVDVTSANAAVRARRGLGRTFQRVEVVNAMTVATNVSLGLEARLVAGNPLRQVLASPAQQRQIAAATDQALEICELGGIAGRQTATLSTGQRRLLELARVLAGGFNLLLLDEPSSGLDEEETHHFGAILTQIVADRGLGILLVEHDMSLVMAVCDYLHVLDFGHLIFEGTPAETRASPIVRAAYLGDDAVEEAVQP